MTLRLLVTGFGPFPTMPRNPSAALAEAVAASPRWRLFGIAAEMRILTTAYGTLASELDPLLGSAPDAVLMTGVAGRSRAIRVETRATSRRSTLFPDVAGDTALWPAAAGRHERRTRAGTIAALHRLQRAALPCRLSRNAGRYLCNACYFRALARPMPVLFIHIPKRLRGGRPGARSRPARLPLDVRLRDALVQIGLDMIRDGRRDAGRNG